MPKKIDTQGESQKQRHIISGFLEGMYYAGQMPSRVESYAIAKYLRSHGLVDGTLKEVEMQVIEAMAVLHREKGEINE